MDIRLALMTGVDIPIPEYQMILHQPTIKEISMIGENDFFTGIHLLCLDVENYSEFFEKNGVSLSEVNSFLLFASLMNEPSAAEQKQQVINSLNIIFPQYHFSFGPRSILVNRDGETFIIDEGNFSILQELLKTIFNIKKEKVEGEKFNPQSEKAKRIAEQIYAGRKKIAEEKSQKDSGTSMFSQYLSILTIGLHSMSLKDLMELTMYQIQDLIERYGLYTSWEIDLRSRLAGAEPKTQPDNWMKNIH